MTTIGGDPTISVTQYAKRFFAMATEPKLVTIPGVEIMEVGENWPLASGPQTFTEDDLLKVIEAINSDAAVHAPRLKVGHADGRLDGEPAFGKFVNMRLINNNQTMVGDLTGVPEWLAKILPTAFPNRSVEGMLDVTTATGKKWPLVLTAVALLGVEMPGISTLEDLRDYYGEEMPDGVMVLASYKDGKPEKEVRATVDVEDVRRSFYETVAAPGTDHYWWWIRCLQIDPPQAIVEDEDAGQLYRIPYSTDGNAVNWSDPVAVEIHYVDVATPVAASSYRETRTFYASAADSRPAERSKMDPKQLRDTLGLAEDASDADVTAKLTELQAAASGSNSSDDDSEGAAAPAEGVKPEEQVPVAAAAAAIPEGMVLVDKETFEATKVGATRANELWASAQKGERDNDIKAAVEAGKIPRSRAEHYAKLWDADKDGTKELLASMASGVIPVQELGSQETGADGQPADQDLYPTEWLSPQERRLVEANAAGTLGEGSGHITTERVGT